MSNITTPEQADEMRENFRASCGYRRKGKVIERKNGDNWEVHKEFKHFNQAKEAVRTQYAGNCYKV